jgi:outer membrane protein assembly factor BamB
VYYTTWSGPGLYAVNPGNGHVRWQFPLDNWFRYWCAPGVLVTHLRARLLRRC